MGLEILLTSLLLGVGFYMAWNIGANDVSNAMGTSVGSGALTLKKAIIIAAVLEFAGAFFLGSNVSQTMQTGIINPSYFANDPATLFFGMLSALLATSIWLQIASYFGWPVSTTHAIVGAIIGFGAIVGGPDTVRWSEIGAIALSWIISPGLSALISFCIFTILQRKVLFAMNPIQASRKIVPFLSGTVLATFTLSVLLNGMGSIKFTMPPYLVILAALVVGVITYAVSRLWMHYSHIDAGFSLSNPPQLSQNVLSLTKTMRHLQRVQLSSEGKEREKISQILESVEALSESIRKKSGFYRQESDYVAVEKMFAALQILSACYVAFAHGANDVANAIGPVAAALEIIKTNSVSTVSRIHPWLLAFGGLGIVIGLATWGWRVIQTIGKNITELTPTRGFSAEFGAAVTILIASKLGMPISTTHCIVGAVLGVGAARGISALNLRTLRDIVLSWIVTIPSAAIVSVMIFYLIKAIFRI